MTENHKADDFLENNNVEKSPLTLSDDTSTVGVLVARNTLLTIHRNLKHSLDVGEGKETMLL